MTDEEKQEMKKAELIAMEDAAVEQGHVIMSWPKPGVLRIEADPKFEAGWSARAEWERDKIEELLKVLSEIKRQSDTIVNPAMTRSTLDMRIALNNCWKWAHEALRQFDQSKGKQR